MQFYSTLPPMEQKVLPPAVTAVCLYPYYSVSIFIQFQFLKMSTCVLYLNHSFLSFCSFAFYVTLKLSNLLQCANLTNCSFFLSLFSFVGLHSEFLSRSSLHSIPRLRPGERFYSPAAFPELENKTPPRVYSVYGPGENPLSCT